MFLKNYTSEVPTSQTVYRIEQVIIKCGAAGISKEYANTAGESQGSLAAMPGSVTPQRVGDDWMEYLDSTGNISRYDGMCECYVCSQIKADYFPWKARKEESKSLNNPGERTGAEIK